MRLILYFFVYSVLGWMAETVWTMMGTGKFQNRRNMLTLPMCPVYGIGAVLMILLIPPDAGVTAVFVSGFFLLSAAEYLYSLIWEKTLGVVWWDYSAMRVHLKGRVSGMYSLIWGSIAVAFVKILHPAVEDVFSGNGWSAAAVIMAVWFAADMARTCEYIQKNTENQCRNFICFERIEK